MLSAIYGAVAAGRRRYYQTRPGARRRLARPVVSIGALATGGRGKTPVTALVAELLREAGERPAILSRGYGRRTPVDGVVVVRDEARILAPVDIAGDEPRMLAEQVQATVLVSEDRFVAGRVAETEFGATVHVLDDGFQHLHLARNVDLVLVDPDDADRQTLPFGPLREPPDTARLADALIVDAPDDAAAAAVAERLGAAAWFRLARSIGPPRMVAPGAGAAPGVGVASGAGAPADGPPEPAAGSQTDTLPAPGDRVVAAAGIAAPERFAAMLRAAGYDVAATVRFTDHHRFTAGDLEKLAGRARAAGAHHVVTTEKDAVRLEPMARFPVTIAAMPLKVSVEPVAQFREWLLARLEAAGVSA